MNPSRIILLLTLFFTLQGVAQPVSIKASVDKNRILLGEPFKLKIEAVYPLDGKTVILLDSIPHFEISGRPLTDSTTEKGVVTIRKTYDLTSFDSGHWVIPSFVLGNKYKSEAIPMDVLFSEFDTAQDYHPIKDIMDVKVQKEQPWWWYAVAGGVLFLGLIVYLLRKRKNRKGKPQGETVIGDPYETALNDLEILRKNKPEARIFYTRLTEIFRMYLFRRKNLLSLQKTTDDLLVQMRSLSLSKEEMDKTAQALRLSDLVKFARYVPAGEDSETAFANIKQSIMSIERSSTKTTQDVL